MDTQNLKRYGELLQEHSMIVAVALAGPGLLMIITDIFRMFGVGLLIAGGAIYALNSETKKTTDGGEPIPREEHEAKVEKAREQAESEFLEGLEAADDDTGNDDDDDDGGLLSTLGDAMGDLDLDDGLESGGDGMDGGSLEDQLE